MLGWIPIEIFPTDEGVNNPIPMRVQMRKDNKQFIAHWVDDYRKGMCGKILLLNSVMDYSRMSIGLEDIDKEAPKKTHWRYFAVPCPECYKAWEKRPKDETNDS